MTPAPSRSLDRAVLTAGAVGLGAALTAGVLLATAAQAPAVLLALGGAAAAAVALVVVQPSPTARLIGVLLLQLAQLGGERGLSALEVVAGLALVGYLAHWYATALASGRPVVRTLFDAAAVTWGTVGFAAAAALGILFGPDAYDFRADVLATLPFLFYLPVKDACARDPRAGRWIVGVICTFGLYATLQNALSFRSVVSGSTALYEIADARFNVGETWITAGLLCSLAAAALSEKRRPALLWVALAGLFLAGLIVTKSRGFWISAAFGIVAMAVVVPGRGRKRLVGFLGLGTAAVLGMAMLFFGEQLTLVALGALDRLVSIGSAAQDISIVNRFAETAAAWDKIRVNPVLGYGWGVQVTHYSVISEGTRHWAFLHNGYVALWYKTGLWGLTLMLAVWVGAMARTARAARLAVLGVRDRALALGAGATMAAFTPAAASSNPFAILDQMLAVTLVLALAHGIADRADAARRAAAEGP